MVVFCWPVAGAVSASAAGSINAAANAGMRSLSMRKLLLTRGQLSVVGNRSDHWLLCERSLSAAAAAMITAPTATRGQQETTLSKVSAFAGPILQKTPH